ncbi:MAG: restriction endonuclease [Candidatus Bathyarchaeia archaeon]
MQPPASRIYRLRYYRRPDVRKFLSWILDGHESLRPKWEGGLYAPDLDGAPGGLDLGILEELSNLGLFHKDIIDAQPLCPRCDSPEFYDRYLCPSCRSPRLERGELIEHYHCGFVGPEGDFARGDGLACPKCGGRLISAGADHGRMRGSFKCLDCGANFSTPLVCHICTACGFKFTHEDAHLRHICEYRFNEALRGEVALALSLEASMAEYLKSKGYRIEDLSALRGASGAEHEFDLVATRGEGSLVISISSSDSEVGEEEVVEFFAKVLDARPSRAVLVAMPRLSEGAMRLAQLYGIGIAEGRDAGEVMASMARLLGE